MAIEEVTVGSLGELIDRLTPRVDPGIGRRRDAAVYHGCSDADRALLTSLDRLGGVDPPHTKAPLEGHLLRSFTRYSRPHLPQPHTNDWEMLVSAQHHGAPTRLLDWTYSPLVAAHFATRAGRPGAGAVVWRLDWHRVHEHFGLPPLALMVEDVESLLGGDAPFTPWRMIEQGTEPPFACLLEPPSLDDRIVVQAATFTICSDTQRSFDAFLGGRGLGDALTRYVVPAAEIGRVRDQLDLVGVDERRLFPHLDGVADAIRRYYG